METVLLIALLGGVAALAGSCGYRAGYRKGNKEGVVIGERTAYNRIKKRENAQASLQPSDKIGRKITEADLPWMG